MAKTRDVVVVGGGVVGCAIAYELTKFGLSVAVLEARRIADEASSVAAGMLTPLAESPRPGPFTDLALAALREYRAVAAEIREASGVDIEYAASGVLRVALNEEQELAARTTLEWQRELGLEVAWLDAEALREREAAITPEARGALLSLEEGHVHAHRLTTALAIAAHHRGAQVRQGTPVIGLLTEGHRVTGVRTPSGDVHAGQVVLAAGPWTGELTAGLGFPLPIRPVKGQLLALAALTAPIRHIVYCSGTGYLVPKADGTILVGATQEEAGFDKRVTVRGVRWLLDGAEQLVPGLGNAEVRELRAGLRPGSPDGAPALGPLPGWEGLTVASGHFRNGILLGPITGRLMAQLVATGQPERDLSPFDPGRFARDP